MASPVQRGAGPPQECETIAEGLLLRKGAERVDKRGRAGQNSRIGNKEHKEGEKAMDTAAIIKKTGRKAGTPARLMEAKAAPGLFAEAGITEYEITEGAGLPDSLWEEAGTRRMPNDMYITSEADPAELRRALRERVRELAAKAGAGPADPDDVPEDDPDALLPDGWEPLGGI